MSQLRAIKKNQDKSIGKQVKTAERAFQEGLQRGRIIGAKETIDLFCDALESLQELKDIGPKRYKAILNHLGYADVAEISKENRWKEQ